MIVNETMHLVKKFLTGSSSLNLHFEVKWFTIKKFFFGFYTGFDF